MFTTIMDKLRNLSKEFIWILIGHVAITLALLFGLRILTHLLDPAIYGQVSLAMTFVSLIHLFIFAPIGQGAMRFFATALEKNDLSNYWAALLQLISRATVYSIFVLLLLIALMYVFGWTKMLALATGAAFLAILGGYNSILSGIHNAARHRLLVAFHEGTETWLRFLLAAGLVICFNQSSALVIFGYSLAVIPVFISQYYFFRKKYFFKNAKNHSSYYDLWQDQIWQYSWPFATWGIFTWAYHASDRWALEWFSPTRDVGLYAVIFQLGYSFISRGTGLVMQFLEPIFYQKSGDGTDKNRLLIVAGLNMKLAMLMAAGICIIFVLTWIYHVRIFKIFVDQKYLCISYLLPWMILAGGIFAIAQTISLNILMQTKTHSLIAPKIITALAGIALNLTGAYLYGVKGVVASAVLFSLLYCIWLIILSKINFSRLKSDSPAKRDFLQVNHF